MSFVSISCRNNHISWVVEFNYAPSEGKFAPIHLPVLPIALRYKSNVFPVGHALVDTGADMTLLPLDIRKVLDVDIDEDNPIDIGSAGGGGFKAFPSAEKITYVLEQKGFRQLQWEGTIYFAPRQPVVLLGHYQCLDQLNLHFFGKRKVLKVEKAS